MNKIYLIIFLLIVIGFSIYFGLPLWTGDNEVKVDDAATTTTTYSRLVGNDLIGTEFIVPGLEIKVKLSADIVDFQDGKNQGSIIFLLKEATAIKLDGKDYVAAPVAANTGGSGTFVYLVLFEKTGGRFTQLDDEFIGDRIKVEKVISTDNKIAVNIFDRKPDEPFSAVPTVPQTLVFSITTGQLVKQ
ncbi:MAG: hypothetical protein QG665_355 [Patescibacteria group bacterium]|nr:hypothetical protein [Patescibacteria group bacterium]